MCRRRFEDILRCIHLVDNDHITTNKNDPSYSKIAKCEWLVREHNALYSQYWQPEQNLTIDEMMIKYCGKYLPIRQYMKAKPTQYGIKIWCLANNASKYVQKMEIYCGKSEECEGKDQNTGYKVVTSSVSGLEHVGYMITCDNWFTSPILFWDLLKLSFRATGIYKTNRRGWPSALTIDKGKAVRGVSRGTMWWRMHASHQLAAVTWLDNKPGTILTTAVSPVDATNDMFVGRRHKNAVKDIPCSSTLVHYQEHMRGVDVQDQLRGNYSVQTRDHKWWHIILLHLLDTSLVNAYILYRARMQRMGETVMSRVKFHYDVATKMCTFSVQHRRVIPRCIALYLVLDM
jgi:hypothetical protein